MAQSRPMSSIVGGGIGGLFAANALIAHGLRVSVYEQAPALGEIGAGVFLTPNSVRHLQRVGLEPAVEKWGARVGPEFALLPPRRRADRAGAGDRLVRLERDLRHAPRRSRRDAGRRPAGRRGAYRTPLHRLRRRTATRRACRSPMAPCARSRRRHRGRRHPLRAAPLRGSAVAAGVLTARSPIGAWCRTSAFRTGRPTAGRCGLARESTSSPSRCAPGELINYVGFVPADEEMKESWSAPGDPDVLRREFAGWDPRIEELLAQVRDDVPLGAL